MAYENDKTEVWGGGGGGGGYLVGSIDEFKN